MQVARLDFDLPAIFQPAKAIDVSADDPETSCQQIGDMTSCHPGRPRKVI